MPVGSGEAQAATRGWVGELVGRRLFWAAVIAVLLAWPIARAVRRALPPKLPVIASVPEFALRDQDDRPFGSAQLRGKVWVANVVSAGCRTGCPALTGRMGEIQHHARNLGAAFRLVTFTGEPQEDSPEVLAAYARRHRASPRMWSFVTGAPDAIDEVVAAVLAVGIGAGGAGIGRQRADELAHEGRFALIDQRMRVRGLYAVETEGEIPRLLGDIGLLIARPD